MFLFVKGNFEMLRNIQIKIVFVFLVVGVIIIGVMGYINYSNLGKAIEAYSGDVPQELIRYYGNIKVITWCTMLAFMLVCTLVRSFCD